MAQDHFKTPPDPKMAHKNHKISQNLKTGWGRAEIFWSNKIEIWSEMGPYGSVGAHIKTGRSPMAQDHF